MSLVFFSAIRFFLVAVLAFSPLAYADTAAAPVPIDLAKGEQLYTNGDTARNVIACISCHGAAGASTISVNPKLGGQHAAYIYKQLKDFQGAERNNPIMSPLVAQLTDAEMKDIAAYLDKQSPSPGAAKNGETLALGKKIYRAGIAEKAVPACAACHSATGAGIPAQYPRIGGQHQDYTITELTNFRSGVRKNGPMMATIAARMSDEEIKAVADYIAGLK